MHRVAHYNRERIRRGATVDKAVVKKNLGRLTRKCRQPSVNSLLTSNLVRPLPEGGTRKATRLFERWSIYKR